MKLSSTFALAATATALFCGPAIACTQDDGVQIRSWMGDCDAISGTSADKCASVACEAALDHLEEQETQACYVALGLGSVESFTPYAQLDAFCHGEGPDPANPGATSSPTSAPVCLPADGESIKNWMNACDSVVGGSTAKCADPACHAALHRLEEEETHACWEHLGLGTHDDFEKYEALDTFCHGEGPDPVLPVVTSAPAPDSGNSTSPSPAPVCTFEEAMQIIVWMDACDSVAGGSAAKCADPGCHAALHHLEEEETHACWVLHGLGTEADFESYATLDASCH